MFWILLFLRAKITYIFTIFSIKAISGRKKTRTFGKTDGASLNYAYSLMDLISPSEVEAEDLLAFLLPQPHTVHL